MREVMRQEKKYLLSHEQFCTKDNIFSQVLRQDKHNKQLGYMVRSLYFDSTNEQDFYDKEDGLEVRKKIRLRVYDLKSDYAVLEMKQKQGDHQKKRSLRMKKEDVDAMTKGIYSSLLTYKEPFAKECYALMNVRGYRPKSIVEYTRKAYVASENKIRITFDYNIKATESNCNIFATDLNLYPVMDSYFAVMEVKYNGFLLSYIKDMVSMGGKSPISVSKYSMSRSVGLHYVFK